MNLPHHRRYNWHMMFRRYRTPVTALAVIILVAVLVALLAWTADALAVSNEALADKREVIRKFDAVVTGVAVIK